MANDQDNFDINKLDPVMREKLIKEAEKYKKSKSEESEVKTSNPDELDGITLEQAKEEGLLFTDGTISIAETNGPPTIVNPSAEKSVTSKEQEEPEKSVDEEEEPKKQQEHDLEPVEPENAIEIKEGFTKTTERDSEFDEMFSFNLDSIEIREANLIERVDIAKKSLDQEAVYQVIPLRSGYSAFMKGLTFKDKDILRNSSLDAYNEKKQLLSIVHDKMQDTSVGKMTFSEFIDITAFDDLDTLLFGIYCQTYPKESEFDITCGHCKKKQTIKVSPTSFIKVKDDNVFQYINDVINRKLKPMELINNSKVHTTKRVILPDSKIIVDIKTPSLRDNLDLLTAYVEFTGNKNAQETFGTMMYIKDLYLPDFKASKTAGKPVYVRIDDFAEKLNYINQLGEDGDILSSEINKKESEYLVEYKLKSFECSHCKEQLGEVPISVESLLFFQMEKRRQTAMESTQK
jgi:hypothetical protein